jgi:transcriptional regulator with XRE-family HTH domain
MREILSARIRELRSARGFSQEELAERVGLTSQAMSNIERKRSLPSLDTLEALARELGATPSSLLEAPLKGEAERLNQKARHALAALSLDDLRLAAHLLDAMVAFRMKR